jgi:hypothetical protein
MKIGQKAFGTQAVIAACLALAAPAAAWAGASDAFYERAFVVAANARCQLFRPELGAALGAATAQARGAALRSGVSETDLNATAARARARAQAVACNSPDLQVVRGRVDGAFSGWTRTTRMTFPGESKAWVADRVGRERQTWRLVQSTVIGASPVAFGYAGQGGASDLTAVVSFAGRSRPYVRVWCCAIRPARHGPGWPETAWRPPRRAPASGRPDRSRHSQACCRRVSARERPGVSRRPPRRNWPVWTRAKPSRSSSISATAQWPRCPSRRAISPPAAPSWPWECCDPGTLTGVLTRHLPRRRQFLPSGLSEFPRVYRGGDAWAASRRRCRGLGSVV